MADYPDFEQTCGYGSVTGIGGANCRHSYWPYVDGVSERTYTDTELVQIDDGLGCEFEGRKYSAYDATQKQRSVERSIRKLKRRKAAFEAAGITDQATAANAKLRALNAEYREFSKAAGLPEQWKRARVLYK